MKVGVYVALLRGINLGGKNKVPMKNLTAMFAEAGCSDAKTYIRSGNVVYRASEALARRLPDLIAVGIADRLGFRAPVVTRTAAELRGVARRNPFLRAGADVGTLHVAFLADRPLRASIAALDVDRSPPDRFAVLGREIYLHCPHGYGRSKLTNQYFDSKLATTSTVRNWRTVLRLIEMARGL
ncbi:MAG: DUF1697 domain-containing protein [Vicinamibacteria bacterium]